MVLSNFANKIKTLPKSRKPSLNSYQSHLGVFVIIFQFIPILFYYPRWRFLNKLPLILPLIRLIVWLN
jgi:hypothetical protein